MHQQHIVLTKRRKPRITHWSKWPACDRQDISWFQVESAKIQQKCMEIPTYTLVNFFHEENVEEEPHAPSVLYEWEYCQLIAMPHFALAWEA